MAVLYATILSREAVAPTSPGIVQSALSKAHCGAAVSTQGENFDTLLSLLDGACVNHKG